MAKKHETPNTDAADTTLADLVSKLGVKAELHGDNLKMTMQQYDKLLAVVESAEYVGLLPKEGRVIVSVPQAAVVEAVAANKRIPRQAVYTDIVARMVYSVNAPESANRVSVAWWEADTDTGNIMVNGAHYEIQTGPAVDFYTADEGEELTDPERKVYYVDLPLVEGGNARLTSYGVTNLIRRVTALRMIVVGDIIE